MLTVFGSVALDTIRTPRRILRGALGGAATYAAVAASYFVRTGLIAGVGEDFPKRYRGLLGRHVDLRGLAACAGKTFRYDGGYDSTLSVRKTFRTDLNVLEGFRPQVPDAYRGSRFVYLANNDPEQNTGLIKEFDRVRFSMCDTVDFWISTKRAAVIKMIKSVDMVVINDEEARLLTKEPNLVRCAKRMRGWGARLVVIKKGEHGSLTFFDDEIFPAPGFPLEGVVDPTGAGDSFAGAMIGRLASKNSTSASSIREAVAYGNAMGSYAVGGYGLGGLTGIRGADVSRRVRAYRRMTRF